jgi:hypothetical protein
MAIRVLLICRIMVTNIQFDRKLILLAAFVATSMVFPAAILRAGQDVEKPGATTSLAPSPSPPLRPIRPLSLGGMSPKARMYYQSVWGVDLLSIKAVSSGVMLRFSYLVLDANRAKALNDKKDDPILIDAKSGARLVIPMLEKVGKLRQTSPPENGRQYWMVFSNKGTLVKPGDKVDIVIGHFRANGLIVQ